MKLNVIVRSYIEKIRPRAQEELDWFRSQPSLYMAVKTAGLALNRKNKRYSHQRRIRKGVLSQAENILTSNLKAISQCANFDELFNLIDHLLRPVAGIGELYVYDTSLRIGAKLNLLPERIYLHAGTRDGAKALGFDGKSKFIELSDFSDEFHKLEPYEIEDVLCIFKDKLKQIDFVLTDKEFRERSCYS